MSLISLDLEMLDPYESKIQAAYEMIQADKFDLIRCSLTGIVIGKMNAEIVADTLRISLASDFSLTADQLVDLFAIQHYVASSRPAPAFRLYKDAKHLSRIMRNSRNGHTNLFAFLAGRFLFESIIAEKDVSSYANLAAKLQFFEAFHERIDSLRSDWHNSLTDEDENPTAENWQSFLTRFQTSNADESKAAQRCFEALCRLDAIHNLRTNFYSQELRQNLRKFAESDTVSFLKFNELLLAVESDGILKLSKQKNIASGNALTLTLALDALTAESKRFARLATKYQSAVDKNRPVVKDIDHLFQRLNILAQGRDNVTPAQEQKITDLLGRIQTDLVLDEAKIDTLHRVATKVAGRETPVQIHRGVKAIQAAKNAGLKLPPEMQAKLDQANAINRVARARAAAKAGKPAPTPGKSRAKTAKGRATAYMAARLDEIFDDSDVPLFVPTVKKEG